MSETIHLLAGWLIDGSGGPVQEKMLLKIVEGRFAAIEKYTPGNGPDPDQITDLSTCTLLPPLIDCHVHLFMSGATDKLTRERQLTSGYNDLRPVIAQHLQYLFSHGVLAVRDAGDKGAYALTFRQTREMHPEMILKVGGRAWHKDGRYGGLIGQTPGRGEGLADALKHEITAVDHVKLVNSGLNSLKVFGRETAPQFSAGELAEAVAVAVRAGRKVMVHANGREPVRLAVEAGCHSIEHGFFMGRDNLEMMAAKGTVWVPTVFTMKAYAVNMDSADPHMDRQVVEKNLSHQLQQLSLARQLGVTVALGTDAGSLGVLHGESVIEEMKLFQKAGYSLAETVQCATSNAAALLGLEGFGLLAKGKVATFLVARGTPLQLPRKLAYLESIYVNGKPSNLYHKDPVKHVAPKQ